MLSTGRPMSRLPTVQFLKWVMVATVWADARAMEELAIAGHVKCWFSSNGTFALEVNFEVSCNFKNVMIYIHHRGQGFDRMAQHITLLWALWRKNGSNGSREAEAMLK
ncbi:hypothetical protein HHK36_033237 [Tetracentron sinense]|uniref:Secreted protein n=1 Tax=Tetracentron sinense TaxID=13715 RepID=A0A835CWY5_TETSI|nr:hypothetical protein HHK36_033237 [Tetracentron sinense]